MSSDSGIRKVEAAAATAAPSAQQQQSCKKKKSEVDEGFVKELINHIDEFVHASYDEHKTCLGKTVRKLFDGMSKVGQSPPAPTSSPTPVVGLKLVYHHGVLPRLQATYGLEAAWRKHKHVWVLPLDIDLNTRRKERLTF